MATAACVGLFLWLMTRHRRHHGRRRLDPGLRYQVLNRGQCEAGIFRPHPAYRCTYCRRTSRSRIYDPDGHIWNVDHRWPVARGGKDKLSNLTLACRRCNLRKGAKVGFWR